MPSSADRGTTGWLGVCALLAVGALAGWLLPSAWIDWQPDRAAAEPWRWWTAAFVHWSPLHLAANLAGLAVLAAMGVVASVPSGVAVAWWMAWPLAHLALSAEPALRHYGGLSGVLHAGVAAAVVWLLWGGRPRTRWWGAAIGAGLAAKVVLERPWAGPLTHAEGWDIAVAPLAHTSGALAGAACTLLVLFARRKGRSPGMPST